MTLGFKPAADLFRQAMANTSVEGERGLSVEKRLGVHIALLRKNKCCFEQPRDEAMVICRIRDVFRDAGATCFATHTWDSAYGKEESLSTFEQFVFEYVLIDYEPNAAGKQVLSRWLREADAAT